MDPMTRDEFRNVFGATRPILGMVHLPPLPGAPNYGGSMAAVMEHALRDAETLAKNGVNALIVENLGDYPYYPFTIEPETVAAMTKVALEIKRRYPMPLGINILRNSWKAALAVAMIVDAQFIRLNILTDTMVTDQGLINGEAHLAMRYRKMIRAENVLIFSDIYSKHAGPLVKRDLSTVAREMVERGMADVIIVSGVESAAAPDRDRIRQVRQAVPGTPVILGSGIGLNTVDCIADADGSVFGYGTKPSGDMGDPVDADTVMRFMKKVRELD
jgi:membrane complex biogenesis BtpA family protein